MNEYHIFISNSKPKAVIAENLNIAIKSLKESGITGHVTYLGSFPIQKSIRGDPRLQFLASLKMMTEEYTTGKDKKTLLNIINKLTKQYVHTQSESKLRPRSSINPRKSATKKHTDIKTVKISPKKRRKTS